MGFTGDNSDPQVKRVPLPSGKWIELLLGDAVEPAPPVADPASEPPAPAAETPATTRPLHVCVSCGSGLVYPTAWEESGAEHWRVELRCPNCEWWDDGIFDQPAVEAFDDALDEGIDVLLADYRALVNSNMEDEIERFAQALQADAIVPSDF